MYQESLKVIKEVEPGPTRIPVGNIAYVPWENVTNQSDHDELWRQTINALIPQQGAGHKHHIELQYEFRMSDGFWPSLPKIFEGKNINWNLHAGIQHTDIASDNENYRQKSIAEYKMMLELADQIGANVIMHLTPHDIPWQDGFHNHEYLKEERLRQLSRGLKSFAVLTEYINARKLKVKKYVENVEFKKFPADLQDTEFILPRILEINPQTGFCVDIPHLWHNHVHLCPDRDPHIGFQQILRDYLTFVSSQMPIDIIHFAGAYIAQKNGNGPDIHATHAHPGLMQGQELTDGINLYLEAPPEGHQGPWLPIIPTLREVVRYANTAETIPILTLEIHEQDQEKAANSRKIINQLLLALQNEPKT